MPCICASGNWFSAAKACSFCRWPHPDHASARCHRCGSPPAPCGWPAGATACLPATVRTLPAVRPRTPVRHRATAGSPAASAGGRNRAGRGVSRRASHFPQQRHRRPAAAAPAVSACRVRAATSGASAQAANRTAARNSDLIGISAFSFRQVVDLLARFHAQVQPVFRRRQRAGCIGGERTRWVVGMVEIDAHRTIGAGASVSGNAQPDSCRDRWCGRRRSGTAAARVHLSPPAASCGHHAGTRPRPRSASRWSSQ